MRVLGRSGRDGAARVFEWPASGFEVAFSGTSCKARLRSTGAVLAVTVDGSPRPDLRLLGAAMDTFATLAEGLPRGPHVVRVTKRTEGFVGSVVLAGLEIDGSPGRPPPPPQRRIEFVGNSITCGYGVLDSVKEHHFDPLTEDVHSGWAFVAADLLAAEARTLCVSGKGLTRNYDGSTTDILPLLFDRVAPRAASAPWDASTWKPHVVVVDLGTNDFSRYPPPDSAAWETALVEFVGRVRKAYGPVPVVLADGPMLSDYWPLKPDGKPFPALATVRAHLENAARRLQGVSVLHLTPNSAERGYGADWHPNRAQAALNGRELAKRLSELAGWPLESRRR